MRLLGRKAFVFPSLLDIGGMGNEPRCPTSHAVQGCRTHHDDWASDARIPALVVASALGSAAPLAPI